MRSGPPQALTLPPAPLATFRVSGFVLSPLHVSDGTVNVPECFGDSVSVNWLPHTHDLGLVSGILQPLFHGHLNVLMSPNAFIQQPIRWLDAISRHRATVSTARSRQPRHACT